MVEQCTEGVTLIGNESQFEAARRGIINCLINQIEERFADMQTPTTKAMMMASLGNWPCLGEEYNS